MNFAFGDSGDVTLCERVRLVANVENPTPGIDEPDVARTHVVVRGSRVTGRVRNVIGAHVGEAEHLVGDEIDPSTIVTSRFESGQISGANDVAHEVETSDCLVGPQTIASDGRSF